MTRSPDLPMTRSSSLFVFLDLDGSMVGPQADHGAAFAERSRGRCRAAAVIDVDLEIGTLNLPAHALGIELEGSVRGKGQLDLPTKGGDIHVAQRSLGLQFDRSIFVFDMDVT